jgi:hypothetical protein
LLALLLLLPLLLLPTKPKAKQVSNIEISEVNLNALSALSKSPSIRAEGNRASQSPRKNTLTHSTAPASDERLWLAGD